MWGRQHFPGYSADPVRGGRCSRSLEVKLKGQERWWLRTVRDSECGRSCNLPDTIIGC
ncbi:hypothetical protein GDO86_010099 [Hymenochirus boettgeri]|uniref:Uncharacterized protein n=1 Tax=Hymenochirus boettgeri TaxID=247094 RepID=A0A8T2JLM5_9PIPI|nr:hypothetical protein GDO86_010099 [Hymenochirus boettgeri]